MSSQAMWEPSGALELSTDDSINMREGCLVAASQDPPMLGGQLLKLLQV